MISGKRLRERAILAESETSDSEVVFVANAEQVAAAADTIIVMAESILDTVDVEPGAPADVREVPLTSGRRLRTLAGRLEADRAGTDQGALVPQPDRRHAGGWPSVDHLEVLGCPYIGC